MSYCTISEVLDTTGMDIDRIQKLSVRHTTVALVNTTIQSFIDDAQKEIRETMKIDSMINKELHLCTGEDDTYLLGPEDQPESFIAYTVENNLVDVSNVYIGGNCVDNRRLRPYPTNCELGTESVSEWIDSTCIPVTSTTRKAGTVSISMPFLNIAQYARYPSINTNASWIDKNIDPFTFMAFYLRSDKDDTTVTVKLYRGDGNHNDATYKVVKKNHWYLVMLDLDQDFTGGVDWNDDPLMYIDFMVDKTCVLLLDNMNFNDYWMYTAPAGTISLMRNMDEQPNEQGYPFYVSYEFDPFLSNVPRNIKKACACLAGVDLIDLLRGVRMEDVEFDAQAESGVASYSKDQFTILRESLLKKYYEALAATGFGFDFTPVDV